MLKAFVWHCKVADGRDRVSRHLCLLTRDAFPRPLRDVLVERGPNDLGADGLTSAFNARVTETVDGVEDHLPEGVRNKGSRWTVADVNDKRSLADVDVLEAQPGSSVVSEAPEVRIQRLMRGYLLPIYAKRSDGVDDTLEILPGGLPACGCAVES